MARAFTGAKAVIKIDGFPLAFASSVNVTHENRLEEIPELDNLEVVEYAQNGHRASITINLFKINENTAEGLGLDPTDLKDILTQPELIIEIYDSQEDLPVYSLFGCVWEGGTGSLDARGLWVGSWTFRARRGKGL